MDVMTTDFFTGLLSIIMIDLVLAGDNALLIGLAAKSLPRHQQKKVILWGTIGALLVRILLTLVALKLLELNGLLLAGGILLVYISFKLLLTNEEHEVKSKSRSFWGALWTILIADILMGMDNIIAVAGAAHGNILLVIFGLMISIPIVVWGSTLVIRLIERFPFIITIGAGVLVWTASKMIAKDTYMAPIFANQQQIYLFEIMLVLLVLLVGSIIKGLKQEAAIKSKSKAVPK
ncbi:TerC family protein [Solibacillus sp. CAU 1738]|uniref:TerC family protein n=1 Tax=Solibacillus sp. CAU 1738 TaxID=3140363 RepID=UPI00326128DA